MRIQTVGLQGNPHADRPPAPRHASPLPSQGQFRYVLGVPCPQQQQKVPFVTQTLKALGQLAILWAIYQGSTWLVAFTGLPIPGNVVGVILLFSLLSLGVLKLKHVELAADFLLKHLVFFFVPIAVGLMEWGQVFYDYGLTLLLAIVISAVLPLLAVGGLSQLLNKRRSA